MHNCAKQLQTDFHHFDGIFGFNFWAVVLDLGWSLGLERVWYLGFIWREWCRSVVMESGVQQLCKGLQGNACVFGLCLSLGVEIWFGFELGFGFVLGIGFGVGVWFG